jgi:hypothetical protein
VRPRAALAVLGVCVALAAPAAAINVPAQDQAKLDEAASWMANRPVTVSCLEHKEAGSPWANGSWSYVYLDGDVIFMDAKICRGLLALIHHNAHTPAWLRAFGALVLTHESFHLRQNMDNRGNEAATECRAIRHAAYMMTHLGATPAEVTELMPYALAEHLYQGFRFPQYSKADCKIPWYW